MDHEELEKAGYHVHYTGKMVDVGEGVMVEQVVVTPPGGSRVHYTPRPQPASGTIYFVGPENGPIKIGFASRLSFRLRQLELANAFPLKVHASTEGPPKLEREYHARFAEHRLHGEWFSPAPAILSEIERIKGGQ